MTARLGYRQRALLAVLQDAGRPLPFGYLVRVCGDDAPSSYHNTAGALGALRARGLVAHPRHGYWSAA